MTTNELKQKLENKRASNLKLQTKLNDINSELNEVNILKNKISELRISIKEVKTETKKIENGLAREDRLNG